MKRAITIILIIAVVAGIFLLGAWFIARNKAVKQNTTKPTFKEFVTGDSGKGLSPSDNPSDLSSVFVDDNLTTSNTPGSSSGSGVNTPGTDVAVFTNDTTVVDTSNNSGLGGGGANSNGPGTVPTTPGGNTGTNTTTPNTNTPGTGTNTTTTTTGTGTNTTPPVTVPPITPGPACTDADLNIQFTPDELQKLQFLQNRFYAVAQTLHTDADVVTEEGNWSNFRVKTDKAEDLYMRFCRVYAPLITDANFKKRVPTPFWHDFAPFTDDDLMLSTSGNYDVSFSFNIFNNIPTDPNNPLLTPNNTPDAFRSLERSLRINLW